MQHYSNVVIMRDAYWHWGFSNIDIQPLPRLRMGVHVDVDSTFDSLATHSNRNATQYLYFAIILVYIIQMYTMYMTNNKIEVEKKL